MSDRAVHGMGILRVTLKHAVGLLAMDSNGKSDPYVKVRQGIC